MRVLEKVLEGMMACHCDLDILLVPIFQPVPQPNNYSLSIRALKEGNVRRGCWKVCRPRTTPQTTPPPGVYFSRSASNSTRPS